MHAIAVWSFGLLLGAAAASGSEGAAHHLAVDVSHHSGAVDWSAVAAEGYRMAYVKATEGVDAADPLFDQHWRALRETEIRRGAYHFYVTEDDPEEQARFFLSRVAGDAGELPPVVDVEVLGHGTRGDLRPKLRRFLEIVEEELGVQPIIYTSPRFWNAHFGEGFGHYPLWVAEYEVDEPTLPLGWEEWVLWQFEGDAAVPGVEKSADRSRVATGVELFRLGDARPSDG